MSYEAENPLIMYSTSACSRPVCFVLLLNTIEDVLRNAVAKQLPH